MDKRKSTQNKKENLSILTEYEKHIKLQVEIFHLMFVLFDLHFNSFLLAVL